jgi:hypothetical protein
MSFIASAKSFRTVALSGRTLSDQTSRLARFIFWIFLLILLAAPVVVAEVYLRSIGLGDPILYYGNTSYRYAPRPNQKHVGQRGAAVTLDSKGLRGVEEWTAPADGKILFVGASVTWGGTFVDDKDLYSNVVCVDLKRALNRDFTCGNAGVNSYGVDNMAERIRYKDYADASAIVVTVVSYNAVHGLADLDSLPSLTVPPPGPFKALWEAATLGAWKLLHILRFIQYEEAQNNERVAERSLGNLFEALRETDRPGRKVLIVLMPLRGELNGKESDLTRQVRAVLERSKLDFLDLHPPISAAPQAGTFFYDEGHLEPAGHRFVGDRIAERLEGFFARRP